MCAYVRRYGHFLSPHLALNSTEQQGKAHKSQNAVIAFIQPTHIFFLACIYTRVPIVPPSTHFNILTIRKKKNGWDLFLLQQIRCRILNSMSL